MKYNFDEIIDRSGTSATKMESLPKGCPDDALPLWVADMDFACAEPILKALHERIDKKIFGYTMYDTDECLGAVLNWYKKRYGWEEQKENLFFCGGIVSAYAVLLNLLTKEGEGVVIQRPIYYPFTMKANSNGRQIVDSPLIYADGNYTIDFDDLDKKMAEPNNKVLVFCSPHNPAGRVWTEEEIRKVVDICKKYDKWIICDEIHCDLLRCGMTFHPILKVAPDYADRIAVCTAPSKTFNLAGMKTSNIVIHNKELQAAWKELIGGKLSMNGAGTLGLTAMIAAYNEGEEWLDQAIAYVSDNKAYLDQFLRERIPQIRMIPSEGTYLVWLDCSQLPYRGMALEHFMINEAKVAFCAGYEFGKQGEAFLRMNVACPRCTLTKALEQMEKAINGLSLQ